jgi:(p)ppGpp synthase/HD superfamily hydrolase
MINLPKIQKAIKFATKTHEVYQKQKRKGKDIPYITHPLTVGIILARVGANDDVVCAGILHDTLEDSVPEKKATFEMLEERFGFTVAQLVLDVTETKKDLPWEERKQQALEHIKTFSHESLLVKSADVISNVSELVDDYNKDGDQVFLRFNAPKEKKIKNSLDIIRTITEQWEENPLNSELRDLAVKLQMMNGESMKIEHPARILEYSEYNADEALECPSCHWQGTAKNGGSIEYSEMLLDVSCPRCEKMLLVVNYPLV